MACVKDVFNCTLKRHSGPPYTHFRILHQDDTWDLNRMYSVHMTRPAEEMLKDGSLDTVESEALVVGDVVLPTDGKDSLKLRLLESLQTFDVLTIQSPGLTSVQKRSTARKTMIFVLIVRP